MESMLERLAVCIERGKISAVSPFPPDLKGLDGVDEITRNALSAGIAPSAILDECIFGMRAVGERFSQGKAFVPDLLLAAKAMKTVMGHLKPHFLSGAVATKGTIVIGTVAGDLHDIGKNLVAMTIEGSGWKVVDLGADVPAARFVASVNDNPGCVVGLSALLTTTMLTMEKTVAEIKKQSPSTCVIVGGAPLTQAFADLIHADAYAANPQGAVAFLQTLEH
ncbi:MAG: cobalamin-dependent protein [Chitinispirillaceae bacterium]|jgi:5-methyltetrahydrofolate--homocysteine methyltransferase|nr:cobalamin-dependent protein [Chitinispirillaceae bacterium]